MAQKPGNYPSGLNSDRLSEAEIRQIAEFYYSLTEAEWIAHYEADYVQDGCTHLIIPAALTDTVGRIIAQAEPERRPSDATERSPTPAKQSTPPEGNFPPGWNLERAQRLIAEMAAEETQLPAADETELRIKLKGKVSVQVPNEIVPAVRALLANHVPMRWTHTMPASGRHCQARLRPSHRRNCQANHQVQLCGK